MMTLMRHKGASLLIYLTPNGSGTLNMYLCTVLFCQFSISRLWLSSTDQRPPVAPQVNGSGRQEDVGGGRSLSGGLEEPEPPQPVLRCPLLQGAPLLLHWLQPRLLLFNVQGIKVLICWSFVMSLVSSYETNVVNFSHLNQWFLVVSQTNEELKEIVFYLDGWLEIHGRILSTKELFVYSKPKQNQISIQF